MKKRILASLLMMGLVVGAVPQDVSFCYQVNRADKAVSETITSDRSGDREKVGMKLAADTVSDQAVDAVSSSAAEIDEDADELLYEIDDTYGGAEGAYITGYRGYEDVKSVTIPETIDGYPVVDISYGAFEGSHFREIKLPNSLKWIDSDAFANCTSLRSITIPEKVISIYDSAFENCSKLKEVNFLGNKIKTIYGSLFAGCKKLESITLPDSVKRICGTAFYRCSKLSSVKLPEGLESIENDTFAYNFALKRIRIPESVTYMAEDTFYHCTNLRRVIFSGNETKFGKRAFSGCTSLKKIKIPDRMKSVPEGAFYRCSSLKQVKLSKNTKLIKKNAFYECGKLTHIYLTPEIYAIGDSAFAYSGLKRLKPDKKLQYIGNQAFRMTKLKKLKLPDKVSFIGRGVFAQCRKLTSISIPASVRGLSPGAFNECDTLKSIYVSPSNRNYTSRDGVLFDKQMTKLLQYPINKPGSSYSVPSSVKVIRSHAFEYNKKLQTVYVSAEKIHNHSFANMVRLKKVVIGNGVHNIAYRAFGYNKKLKEVSMSDSVRVIAGYAFSESGIKRFHVPASIRSFSPDALAECGSLSAYDGRSYGKYPVIDGVLYENGGTTLREYPAKKADTSFTVPDRVRNVKYNAIYNVKKLKRLYFGAGIKNLHSGAISYCSSLREIVFAEGTKLNSGSYAVEECNKLAVIVGPAQGILEQMAINADTTLITL
ncbi:MAG: leucine-rich repeat protein [Eubacterium sp.]|nr:leucine-rich repeat protein [Eubacterium sp.]